MSSSNDEPATLAVVPSSPLGPKNLPRRIQVTDGALSLVAKGFGELQQVQLSPGIYKVRVESKAAPFEQMVFLSPGEPVSVSYPVHAHDVLVSAAPVPGTESMRELLRKPLEEAITRPVKDLPGRFVLMANCSDPKAPPPIDLNGFRLLNDSGKLIGDLGKATPLHSGKEFKLLTYDVSPGGLVLEGFAEGLVSGTRIRQPLWCSTNWCTLLFVRVNATTGRPDLNTASVYQWRVGASFAPEASSNSNPEMIKSVLDSQRYAELALHSLANGRNALSKEELDAYLLRGKFQNPMLGILGCHLLLQAPDEERKRRVIETVLRNLDRLVPNHPDVIALHVMARQMGMERSKRKLEPLSWPPSLRQGFLAVRKKDWDQPGLVEPGSLYDRVRTRLLSGSVWARWLAEGSSEFVAAPSAVPRARRNAPRRRPKVVTTASLLARQAVAYAKQLFRAGRDVKAEDLKWSGLSRQQANDAARLLTLTNRNQRAARFRPPDAPLHREKASSGLRAPSGAKKRAQPQTVTKHPAPVSRSRAPVTRTVAGRRGRGSRGPRRG